MVKPKTSKYFTLRVSLKGTEPEVWREIVVHESLSFYDLHEVIQVAMGWYNCHLFAFQFGRDIRLSCVDPNESFGMIEELDAARYKLSKFVEKPRQKFTYEYDFGDTWIHEIKVVKVTPVEGKPLFKSTILDGANACPPEDCGGIPGFHNLKLAIADPKHPDHKDLKEWLGFDFDPTKFNLKEVHNILESKGGARGYWKAVSY